MERTHCTNCGTDNPITSKYCSSCGYELPKIDHGQIPESVPQKVRSSKENRKKPTSIIIGIIFFAIAYIAVQQLFFKNPSLNKLMMEVATEINKTCPIMLDSETRLDNTIALPDNVFQYNYTLINMEKRNVDTTNMKNYLVPRITNFVKTNPQMNFQREHKTTVNYYYNDKYGVYLFLISITPDKYL